MEICAVCKKSVGNGIITYIPGGTIAVRPTCLLWSMDPKAKAARINMKTKKKGKVNAELDDKHDWAPFSTSENLSANKKMGGK